MDAFAPPCTLRQISGVSATKPDTERKPEGKGQQPEIYPLTGVRAVAALWVVFYHLGEEFAKHHPAIFPYLYPFIVKGFLGVDLFFILSGFIIFYNYAERMRPLRWRAYGEFLWLRLARLWPVHLVMLVLFAIAIGIAYHVHRPPVTPGFYTVGAFIQNLFLVHNWAIPAEVSWNVPAWSISCEWFAYLLFPLIVLSRLSSASARTAIVVAVGALLAEDALCEWVGAQGDAKYGILRILGEFTSGAALCRLYRLGAGRNLPWNVLIPAAIGAEVVTSYWLLPAWGLCPYWAVPFLALIVFGLSFGRCATSRLLSTRVFLFGGYISYSLYMVHELCNIMLTRSNWTWPLLQVTVMIAAATAMYYIVEEPCRRAMRRMLRRRQQPEAMVA